MPLPAWQKRGKNTYFSSQLSWMARTMNLTTLCDTLGEGTHYKVTQYGGLSLTIIVSDGEVRHVGYSIFTPAVRHVLLVEPLNFIERYLLSLEIPTKRVNTVKSQLEEDGVIFEIGTPRWPLSATCDTTYDISIQHDSRERYTVAWSKAGQTVCQVSFPVSYQLLLGMQMNEIEQTLKRRVTCAAMPEADTLQLLPDSTLLPSARHEYYVKRGGVYYFAELNSNKYYEKLSRHDSRHSVYRLLFSARHVEQSLANLLTTADVPNSYLLEVRQRTCNYTDTTFQVPLSQWVAFCLKTGCTPYFALLGTNDDVADCELIMRNETLGYNHVMRLKIDIGDMENRRGIAHARLYAYIPTHNILHLFKELNK